MRGRACRLGLAAMLLLAIAACSGGRDAPPVKLVDPRDAPAEGTYKLGSPYQINGIWYYPEFDPDYEAVGVASWYGDAFHGRPTANGELFDMRLISAAHPTLPMPSLVEVTNLENGRSIELRVNDRGPFHDNRLIDLSQAAARELGFEGQGLARVRVRFLALLPAHGTPPVAGTTTRPKTVLARAEDPVVVPAAAPAPSARPQQAAAGGSTAGCGVPEAHFVQVAALSQAANAANLAARLNRLGRVEIDEANPPLARVRLGPYPSRRDAFGKLAKVHQLGYRDALVVSCS